MSKTAVKMQDVKNYSLEDSADLLHLATEVATFIKEKKLFTVVQGKEHVNVEGWQYAGARLGLVAIPITVFKIETGDDEILYQAEQKLIRLSDGMQIGGGTAVCSNREQGKKYYQQFAIASMAQTRATGKCFRNLLAWIIRAAGYEATPSEEMDYAGNVEPAKAPVNTEKKATPAPTPAPAKYTQEAAVKPTPAPAKPLNVDTKEKAPEAAPTGTEAAPAVRYASAKQKEEIISLLNSPVISRQEKTKMLLNINRFDEERAAGAIEKLKKVIEDREEGSSTADPEKPFKPASHNQLELIKKFNMSSVWNPEEKAKVQTLLDMKDGFSFEEASTQIEYMKPEIDARKAEIEKTKTTK